MQNKNRALEPKKLEGKVQCSCIVELPLQSVTESSRLTAYKCLQFDIYQNCKQQNQVNIGNYN